MLKEQGFTDHPIFFTHFAIPKGSPHASTRESSKTLSRHRRATAIQHPYAMVLEPGADFNQGRYLDDELFEEFRTARGDVMLAEVVFPPDQVERLTEGIHPAFRALVYSAVYLGCRWGELVGLKRANLNLLKREVRIVGSLEEVNGGPRYVEETKTSASRRTLSIPPFLTEELSLHFQRAPESAFVFTAAKGALLRRSNFRKRYWKPAVNRAELDSELRFHDLRHSCASILIASGAHPKEIQARLGHASITTTLDRYGHLFPSLGSQLDESLEVALREARSARWAS